jgi:hypothetical protein
MAGAQSVSQPSTPESFADDFQKMGAPRLNSQLFLGTARADSPFHLAAHAIYLADQTTMLYVSQIEFSAEMTWPRRA